MLSEQAQKAFEVGKTTYKISWSDEELEAIIHHYDVTLAFLNGMSGETQFYGLITSKLRMDLGQYVEMRERRKATKQRESRKAARQWEPKFQFTVVINKKGSLSRTHKVFASSFAEAVKMTVRQFPDWAIKSVWLENGDEQLKQEMKSERNS